MGEVFQGFLHVVNGNIKEEQLASCQLSQDVLRGVAPQLHGASYVWVQKGARLGMQLQAQPWPRLCRNCGRPWELSHSMRAQNFTDLSNPPRPFPTCQTTNREGPDHPAVTPGGQALHAATNPDPDALDEKTLWICFTHSFAMLHPYINSILLSLLYKSHVHHS